MEKGYIHIYTGNGKGKTTAAFGLALRAICSGKKVYIGQFVKSMKYNETKIETSYPKQICIEQYGRDCFINHDPEKIDVDMAQKGLEKITDIIMSEAYDLVILDEVTIAIYYKLITTDQLIKILKNKPQSCELVITGRYAPNELYQYADLITEMQEIKHYYQEGVLSRDGIDR